MPISRVGAASFVGEAEANAGPGHTAGAWHSRRDDGRVAALFGDPTRRRAETAPLKSRQRPPGARPPPVDLGGNARPLTDPCQTDCAFPGLVEIASKASKRPSTSIVMVGNDD